MPPPPAKKKQTPLAMPPTIDASMYANIGRYAGAVVMTVFEQIGGIKRMAEWADENPGEFFKGPLMKIISAPKEVNVSGTITIEEAIKALDYKEGEGYTTLDPNVVDAVIEEDEE